MNLCSTKIQFAALWNRLMLNSSENMDVRGLVAKRDSRMPMDADPCRGGGPPSPA
jgi:hypothetical protein